jgi:PAS domain S-box-containing protein
MKLHKKTLTTIGVTFGCLIVILYAVSRSFLNSRSVTFEEEALRKDIRRATSALNERVAALSSKSADWANWDDTYEFAEDRNDEYIESNLGDKAFVDLGINLMMFLNEQGEIVFSKYYDLKNHCQAPVPPGLKNLVPFEDGFAKNNSSDSEIQGIVLVREFGMEIVSRPILTSDGEGPPHGTLIMGRNLDAQEIRHLAEVTELTLSLRRVDDAVTTPDFTDVRLLLSMNNPVVIKLLDKNTIAGYTLIKDIYGNSAFTLEVKSPRDLYMQSMTSLSYFMLLLITVGMVFAVMMLWLLEKLVLARLARLSADADRIGAITGSSSRVHLPGRDELSGLADAINGMLARLEQSQREVQINEERYRNLFDESLAGNYISTPDGAIRLCNLAYARLLGLNSPAEVMKSSAYSFYKDKTDREQFLNRLRAEKRLEHYEKELVRADGKHITILENVIGTFNENGDLVRLNGNLFDITERKQADNEQQLIHSITNIASTAENLDTMIQLMLDEIVKFLEAKNLFLALYDRKSEMLSFPYFVDEVDDVPAPRKLKRGLTEWILRHGTALSLSRELFNELLERQEIEQIGTLPRSFLGVPLMVKSKTIGALVIQSYDQEKLYDEETERVLSTIATQLASVLERKRAEDELRVSEERYRDLFESAGDLIMIVNADNSLAYCNKAWHDTLGFKHEEMKGLSLEALLHDDCRGECMELLDGLRAGEPVGLLQAKFVKKDGRIISVEGQASANFKEGKLDSIRGIFRDVTEQRRLEQEVLEAVSKAKHLEGIHQVAVTLQHEINNPLSGVIGNAEIMAMILPQVAVNPSAKDIESLKVAASDIVDMANRIAKTVEKLKYVYKPVLAIHPVQEGVGAEMIDLKDSE